MERISFFQYTYYRCWYFYVLSRTTVTSYTFRFLNFFFFFCGRMDHNRLGYRPTRDGSFAVDAYCTQTPSLDAQCWLVNPSGNRIARRATAVANRSADWRADSAWKEKKKNFGVGKKKRSRNTYNKSKKKRKKKKKPRTTVTIIIVIINKTICAVARGYNDNANTCV